ncbi:MAG: RNA methyltransferase [bacterium]
MQHSIRIILVRPRNPDNIGASARAMSNFGFSDLSVVSPYLPAWRETLETAATAGSGEPIWLMEGSRAAVGAVDIIGSAKIFATVAEAASDCILLLGTSALQRRAPDRDVYPLSNINAYLGQKLAGKSVSRADGEGPPPAHRYFRNYPEIPRVGLLFGSEKSGLSNADISHCHAIINIPTCEKQPSINLGQAVALCCYELAGRSSKISGTARRFLPRPSIRETERTVTEICSLLKETGEPGRRGTEYAAKVRRTLLDAELTRTGLNILRILLRRARSAIRPE